MKAATDQTNLSNQGSSVVEKPRRDFIVLTASAMAGIGAASMVLPLVDSLNPAKDVLSLASVDVDVSSIQEGQGVTVMWRGQPIFVRHRTTKEIQEARNIEISKLPDPEADQVRVKDGKDKWLVLVGVCTHLGCVPIGEQGDYDGWFCPCHGSHYDTSGRIRKGPAPSNLPIPPYEFIEDNVIRIG